MYISYHFYFVVNDIELKIFGEQKFKLERCVCVCVSGGGGRMDG